MPKAPLTFEHLAAISETLNAFCHTGADTVKIAVCMDLKIKLDKKLTGWMPDRGFRVKLTRPELELVKQLNQLYAFHHNVKYANSYLRLIQQNIKCQS